MPRPRRPVGASSPLSPGQAAYVIERLISERRVSPGDVNRYISEMGREISDLEERLNRLRAAHGGYAGSGSSAPAPARRGRPVGSGRKPGRPAGSGKRRGRPPASASADAGSAAGAAATPSKRGGKRGGKKRSAITAEQLASRQLQGRYLALVRQFAENKRIQYAKVAKERGREAAIREMQDSLKK
jgi:hypothetical protein